MHLCVSEQARTRPVVCRMFFYARSFNQPIQSWNIQSLVHAERCLRMHVLLARFVWQGYTCRMFYGASSFNQKISNWRAAHEYKAYIDWLLAQKRKLTDLMQQQELAREREQEREMQRQQDHVLPPILLDYPTLPGSFLLPPCQRNKGMSILWRVRAG